MVDEAGLREVIGFLERGLKGRVRLRRVGCEIRSLDRGLGGRLEGVREWREWREGCEKRGVGVEMLGR